METQVHSLLKVHQKVSDNKKIEKKTLAGEDGLGQYSLYLHHFFIPHTCCGILKFPCLFCLVGGQGWKGVIIIGKKENSLINVQIVYHS